MRGSSPHRQPLTFLSNCLVERVAGLPDGNQYPAPPLGQLAGLMQPAASPHPAQQDPYLLEGPLRKHYLSTLWFTINYR
ncbi:hypothetical protein CC2G_009953 [Coprinopsis cinerea AmutBmut pab1-1]|nr:hypothetical protein CC2G_009953 [Coprinopsis cinerea AmutBmut pab1-1]